MGRYFFLLCQKLQADRSQMMKNYNELTDRCVIFDSTLPEAGGEER